MKLSDLSLPREFFIEGSLALKRNVFLRKFLMLLNVFMLPLSIFWLFNEHWVLGCSLLLFLGTFNTNVFWTIKDRPFVISYPLVMLTLSLTLFVTVFYIGFSGALWTYPIIIALYFIIPLKEANYSNFIIVVPIAILIFFKFESSLAIRYCASISATVALGIMVVNTIVDLQKKLLKQSSTDPLTGAFNRRHMDSILNNIINRRDAAAEADVILMFDIDYFKKINDSLGHETGDVALQRLVEHIKGNIRKSDIIFRMGGEEFILLLRDTSLESALGMAESLRQSIAKIVINECGTNMTVSVGLSVLSENMSYSQWLNDADACLYEAKRLGRNRVISQLQAS